MAHKIPDDKIPDAHVGALADALGVPKAWSRKLLEAYESDLAQAATDWRQDRARTAAKAGIEMPGAGQDALDATRASDFSGGGESKKSASSAQPRPSSAADPMASSFFDFTDRHTSHLSAPAAQPVSWTDRKTPFATIPEGISKPTSAARAASEAAVQASTPPTTSSKKAEGGGGGSDVSRKNGAIPGYRRPQPASPRAERTSQMSPSPVGAPSTGAVAYDVIFIMDQLARGKITQDQFDQLNAVLM